MLEDNFYVNSFGAVMGILGFEKIRWSGKGWGSLLLWYSCRKQHGSCGNSACVRRNNNCYSTRPFCLQSSYFTLKFLLSQPTKDTKLWKCAALHPGCNDLWYKQHLIKIFQAQSSALCLKIKSLHFVHRLTESSIQWWSISSFRVLGSFPWKSCTPFAKFSVPNYLWFC
jgi:hypothetical protein